MTTRYWIGGATANTQTGTVTPANVESTDVFTMTFTEEDGSSTVAIAFTATAATVGNVTAGLTAALNASDDPIVKGRVTAADDTTHVTLTTDTAGQPFYVACTTADGGGNDTQTLTWAETLASIGPYDWNVAVNWSGGAVPVNTDDVLVEDNALDILYGLDQSAVTLDSLKVSKDFLASLGQADYPLTVNITAAGAVWVGYYYGSGSPVGPDRVNLDLQTSQCAIEVFDSNASSDGSLDPVRLVVTHASTTLIVHKGRVGVASQKSGQTSQLTTIFVGYVASQNSDSKVNVGPGVTLGTFKQTGGTNVLQKSASTLVQVEGGFLSIVGSQAVTAVTCTGGVVSYDSTGAITTLNVGADAKVYLDRSGTVTTVSLAGELDMRRSSSARTITNLEVYSGAKLYMNEDNVTTTNGIDLHEADISDVTLILGKDYRVTLGAIA